MCQGAEILPVTSIASQPAWGGGVGSRLFCPFRAAPHTHVWTPPHGKSQAHSLSDSWATETRTINHHCLKPLTFEAISCNSGLCTQLDSLKSPGDSGNSNTSIQSKDSCDCCGSRGSRWSFRHVSCIVPFNPHNSSMRWILFITLLFQWGNQSSENSQKLREGRQMVRLEGSQSSANILQLHYLMVHTLMTSSLCMWDFNFFSFFSK